MCNEYLVVEQNGSVNKISENQAIQIMANGGLINFFNEETPEALQQRMDQIAKTLQPNSNVAQSPSVQNSTNQTTDQLQLSTPNSETKIPAQSVQSNTTTTKSVKTTSVSLEVEGICKFLSEVLHTQCNDEMKTSLSGLCGSRAMGAAKLAGYSLSESDIHGCQYNPDGSILATYSGVFIKIFINGPARVFVSELYNTLDGACVRPNGQVQFKVKERDC
jgi:hypothetical protein